MVGICDTAADLSEQSSTLIMLVRQRAARETEAAELLASHHCSNASKGDASHSTHSALSKDTLQGDSGKSADAAAANCINKQQHQRKHCENALDLLSASLHKILHHSSQHEKVRRVEMPLSAVLKTLHLESSKEQKKANRCIAVEQTKALDAQLSSFLGFLHDASDRLKEVDAELTMSSAHEGSTPNPNFSMPRS